MTQSVTGKQVGIATANGLAPKRGARSLIQSIDFSVMASPVTLNFAESQMAGKIEFIQTLKIDNTQNANPLSISMPNTNDLLIVPAYAMMIAPVMASKESAAFIISTTGTPLVNILFLPFMLPAMVWFPNGTSGNGNSGQSGGTDYSANLPAVGANLITTVPAGARNAIVVQNLAASQVQLLLDDSSIILLESGGGDNIAGGAWRETAYNGRVRIYSAEAAAPVSAYVL